MLLFGRLTMNNTNNYRNWIILIHAFFWAAITMMMFLLVDVVIADLKAKLVLTCINLGGILILVYGHLYYLRPRFFLHKKYVKYTLGLLLLLLLAAFIRYVVGWTLFAEKIFGASDGFKPSFLGSMLFSGLFMIVVSTPLQLIEDWFKKQELQQEIRTQQLEAELRFLKAQVNPHFLFNALNNIYALSFTASKKAPEMILQLSEMMSYMLYDCKQEQVNLALEIAYLKNYISLQQLKKDGEFDIDFQVKGGVEQVNITPMLFIPFFENAFKHGNLEAINIGWLKSRLEVADGMLHFTISNSKPKVAPHHAQGGVGLENIRERLDLIYPGKHELMISDTDEVYTATLSIKLLDL